MTPVGVSRFLIVNGIVIILSELLLQHRFNTCSTRTTTFRSAAILLANGEDLCRVLSDTTKIKKDAEEDTFEVDTKQTIDNHKNISCHYDVMSGNPNACRVATTPPEYAKSWLAAQKLHPPAVTVTDHGEAEGAEWWLQHEDLLQQAWEEWTGIVSAPSTTSAKLPSLNDTLINPILRALVRQAWNDPTTELEDDIKSLWDETMSSSPMTPSHFDEASTNNVLVHKQLVTREGVEAVRTHLDAYMDSQIPLRRPNAMNRYGILFDPSVPGSVGSTTPLMVFLTELVDEYIRPLGRLFFPSFVGEDDDAKFYAFSIRYSADEDIHLKEHSDASVVTLNLNLNLPHEDFSGSSIYFVRPSTKKSGSDNFQQQGEKSQRKHQQQLTANTSVTVPIEDCRQEIRFGPGMALLHRGMTRHAALPLENGSRQNLVVWLYGRDDSVRIAPYEVHEQLTLQQRWEKKRRSIRSITDDSDNGKDGLMMTKIK